MTFDKKSSLYILCFTFVSAVTFVYLLISIALVPYWQGFSGTEIQAWWSGPFTRFSILMVPVHMLSIITTIIAFIMHRKEVGSIKIGWIIALIALLICQVFNFTLHGAVYNPALQSGTLTPEVALNTFDDWNFYHTVRTLSICISLIALIMIGMTSTKKD